MEKILNRISKIISSSSKEINENLKKYKGEIIVIKYGGSAMLNPMLSETFFKDIKLLVEANIRPIIVHGGGPQINESLKALKIEHEFYKGMRKTDSETLKVVQMVLIGSINKNITVKDYENTEPLELQLDYDTNFLSVAQWGPRKNMLATVKWFVEEFHDDNVGLVIKTNLSKNCLIAREIVADRMHALIRDFPDRKCKLYLIHGEMTDQEIHALYSHPKIDAMVSFAHGEGFGLPLFEAAYSGLPIVTIGWSGHMDFLVDQKGERRFYDVAYDLANIQKEAVWDNVLIPESMWAFARPHDAKKQMRQCYEDLTDPKKSKKILVMVLDME